MAEWLCSGLQSRLRRFDSGFSLQKIYTLCPGGGIGRHKGLKIPRRQLRAGSSPALGTNVFFKKCIILINNLDGEH